MKIFGGLDADKVRIFCFIICWYFNLSTFSVLWMAEFVTDSLSDTEIGIEDEELTRDMCSKDGSSETLLSMEFRIVSGDVFLPVYSLQKY